MRKGVAVRVSESVRGATAAPVAQILCIPDAPDARLLTGIALATCRVLHRGRIARSTDRPTESRGAADDRGPIGAATGAGGRDDGDLHGGSEHFDRCHCDADDRRRARRISALQLGPLPPTFWLRR